jgi:hypothetical protein
VRAGFNYATTGVSGVDGYLDESRVLAVPVELSYRFTSFAPWLSAVSGFELQRYDITSSSSTNSRAKGQVHAIKIPALGRVSYGNRLFVEAAYGLCLTVPFSHRLTDASGMDISSIDDSGHIFDRTRPVISDDLRVGGGLKLNDRMRIGVTLHAEGWGLIAEREPLLATGREDTEDFIDRDGITESILGGSVFFESSLF